eukprot:1864453-Pyramimonas_sp.AAC.1
MDVRMPGKPLFVASVVAYSQTYSSADALLPRWQKPVVHAHGSAALQGRPLGGSLHVIAPN